MAPSVAKLTSIPLSYSTVDTVQFPPILFCSYIFPTLPATFVFLFDFSFALR